MDPITPLAWRARHQVFADAVRQLRRLALEGPSPRYDEQLERLTRALEVHVAFEEGTLLPRYAEQAPPDGPGAVDAVLRDHHLIKEHLAALAHPPTNAAEALFTADRAAKLEALLEHHDVREGRFVLPALEALGVRVMLDEPPCASVPLGALVPLRWPVRGADLEGVAETLAQGVVPTLPPAPSGGRIERHAAGLVGDGHEPGRRVARS